MNRFSQVKALTPALFAMTIFLPQTSYGTFADEAYVATDTTEMTLRANLSATSFPGDTYHIASRALNALITRDVFFTFTKTPNDFEWDFSVNVPDAIVGGVFQGSGANTGAAYTNMTIQFDRNYTPHQSHRLLSFNGIPAEITPPMLCINYVDSASDITLNFGEVGTPDAIRISDDLSETFLNTHSGIHFAHPLNNHNALEAFGNLEFLGN